MDTTVTTYTKSESDRRWSGWSLCVLGVLGVLSASVSVAMAQFQMPDMKSMSGIPRPVDDLPAGSISVRLIRGSLSNNITGHPVELHVGGKVRTAKTDDTGRAQFDKIPAGTTVKATADVDGEHLESQEFPAPAQGGIRLMLVAIDKNAAPATQPDAAPIPGQVVISNQSRIVMEPGDEAVNVFYLLDIENTARVPVNPPAPFAFDLPKEAVGSGVMEGSTPQAALTGRRVVVQGPFAPGHTFLQVGMSLPSTDGSIEISQAFPANIQSLAVVAQKVGNAALSSPQITNQREMPADGQTFIAATGGAINAGQPISLTLSGLPHHNAMPRRIALLLALAIAVVGIVALSKPAPASASQASERKRLLSRREKLLNELVKLETDRRAGRADDRRYATRRDELIVSLEHVYGALDSEEHAVSSTTAPRLAAPAGALGAS
jgi:hypothetical protein